MLKALETQVTEIKTSYGVKWPGSSPFVIIAPHAAGDDLKTGAVAREIANLLGGFLIVNKFYFKETNSKSLSRPERVGDFNKLSWSSKHQKYLWKRKKPAMKEFFDDIANYCDEAQKYSNDNKSIAVYIHGMRDDEIGIDIGVGIRSLRDNHRFIGSAKSEYYCSGVSTIRISQLKKLKQILQSALIQKHNLRVGIGKIYPAWSKRIAIQFHKHCGRDDYAIQLEINHILKDNPIHIHETALLISDSLRQIFQ